MKDISRIAVELSFAIEKKLIPKLIEAQRKTAEKTWEDVVESAPLVRGDYVSSIQISPTEDKDDVIKTSIFSDLKVGGDIPKWQNVLLANFINWGTGPLGEASNIYPHGYPYTTDKPWNYEAQRQFELTGTWGMKANPHFYQSLQKNVGYYKDQIKEAFR